MIVGRTSEQARFHAVLARARQGESTTLVVAGDPGIGKTTLLDDVVSAAADWIVLRAEGIETEAELAFAGLGDLLRPLVDRITALPDPQAEALLGALALRSEPANPLAVRVALLELLADLSDDRPVLVVVDDAQWVDRPSLELLGFALRRLTVEPVAAIVATRDESVPGVAVPPEEVLVVGPLPDGAARDLLAARDRTFGSDALVAAAGGNPLALLELPAAPVAGPVGIAPLAPGPRLVAAYEQHLGGLSEETRWALGVVAAAGTADAGVVQAALDELGLTTAHLHDGERDGLVVIGPGSVSLRHPLLRSVAYHALSPPDRRRIHAALARSLSDPSQRDRRAWHLAEASDGVDEAVAVELEGVARDAARRGAPATAAAGLARAAVLTPVGDERARRHLDAAKEWWVAERWPEAVDQLTRARNATTDPRLLADVDLVWGQTESYQAGPAAGAAALVTAADRVEGIDAGSAVVLLAHATNAATLAGDAVLATRLSTRAHELAARFGEREDPGGMAVVVASLARLQAGLLDGDDELVSQLLEPVVALADGLAGADLAEVEQLLAFVLFADFVREDWDAALRRAEAIVTRARRTGRVFALPFALAVRSEIDWRCGRWSDAYASVTGDDWGSPADAPVIDAWLQAVQARIEAGLGLDEEARAHAEAALAASGGQPGAATAWAQASLGFLDLGRGRPQAAAGHLAAVAEQMAAGGVRDPAILWWAGDLVEALWRLGRIGDARRCIEDLRILIERTPRVWARAIAARGDALLASDGHASEAAFAAALVVHEERSMPFEHARTLLLLAERRRQLGSGDHREPAREALGAFERLGAAPWTEQALRVLGDQRTAPPAAPLTKQERQVAAVVGRGATNREAAAELFLSPKTVDFHLRNIYRKLGLRSRTELARRLAEEAAGIHGRRGTDLAAGIGSTASS